MQLADVEVGVVVEAGERYLVVARLMANEVHFGAKKRGAPWRDGGYGLQVPSSL
jgi:hypothetical protein